MHITQSHFSRTRKTKLGVAILSQTCDIVQNINNVLIVSPVVLLQGEEKSAAQKGRNARHVSLPAYGESYFVDLAFVGTCSIKALRRATHSTGVQSVNQNESSRFGQLVGRRFSRFPFPDEIHPYLHNLKEIFIEKSDKDASSQKWAMDFMLEIRVEAGPPHFWSQPPYALTLLFVVKQGVLPQLANPPVATPGIDAFLNPINGIRPSADRIATRLMENETSSNIQPLSGDDKVILWNELVDRWAALVKIRNPAKFSMEIQNALASRSVSAELIPVDEIPYSRIVRSQALDLQHLSNSYPISE